MDSEERGSIARKGEVLARKIAGGHHCAPPVELTNDPPSAGDPLAEPSTSGTATTPQRKVVEWFPQVAAGDHRQLVGLLLRVAPETVTIRVPDPNTLRRIAGGVNQLLRCSFRLECGKGPFSAAESK